jgi:hypothetical protein
MKLTLLHEAYWQPIADHPGQLGKLDKRAKKNDKSFLIHPEDRKRWLKWFGGIKEDLDDKDEFTNNPTPESIGRLIDQLRLISSPKAPAILRTMERMYERLFGAPYTPRT